MKYDGTFLIGDVNIFDFQKTTGFKRWNTWAAAGHPHVDIFLP